MTPDELLDAARCSSIPRPVSLGPWRVETTRAVTQADLDRYGRYDTATRLSRASIIGSGFEWRELVMTDTERALRRHLPIFTRAYGHVLVTGLGLGCVVRGLLANRDVTRVTVIERDRDVIELVGTEFEGLLEDVVDIYRVDAFEYEPPHDERYDWAWHDLYAAGLQNHELDARYAAIHTELVDHLQPWCDHQGYWAMPNGIVVY